MHGLGFLWLAGKIGTAVNFLLYRLAVWSGTVYLYRRGKRRRQKLYYALAFLTYAVSWGLVILWSSKLWGPARAFLRR